jgi:ribosomal protein S18
LIFDNATFDHQHLQKEIRDTILDLSGLISSPDAKSMRRQKQYINNNGREDFFSSESSYENEGDGIVPLLETFCKKGDLNSLQQFQSLIVADTQRLLLHRAIEYKQLEILKFILTQTGKI